MVRQAENGVSAVAAVDRDLCMGSGNCVYSAPGVFDLDDSGIAVVTGEVAGHEDEVRRAARSCPSQAIGVEGLEP